MKNFLFFWAAGIGFTSMQIFLYLENAWAKAGLIFFMIFAVWIFAKTPKEFQIIYWIVLTLLITFWYYGVKPSDSVPAQFRLPNKRICHCKTVAILARASRDNHDFHYLSSVIFIVSEFWL